MASGMKCPVYKKASANEKVTMYLESRDVGEANSMAGVVVADPTLLKDKSVFVQLACSFRYGHEDDEMFGLKYQMEMTIGTQQLYFCPVVPKIEPIVAAEPTEPTEATATETDLPEIKEEKDNIPVPVEVEPALSPAPPPKPKPIKLSTFQERVVSRFGSEISFPFLIPFLGDSPSSVTIESGKQNPKGKAVGLEYFLKAFVGEHEKDYTNRNSTVQMAVRKIQYAPQMKKGKGPPPPKTIVKKEFLMSRGEIEMQVSLDKQIYHHGDTIKVVLTILNKSTKTVRKYKTLVEQYVNTSVFKNGRIRNAITSFVETEYGVPIPPGGKLNTFLHLTPTLDDNKGRSGIAKDGQLRLEDGTTLASSSLFADPDDENSFGIVVSYSVKVKLYLSVFGGIVIAEIPFFLMHPPQGPVRKPSAANKYRRAMSMAY